MALNDNGDETMKDTAGTTNVAKGPPPLPVGNSDWAHVAAHNWIADKTQLIAGLLDRDATVALFTRPRRFGKTFAVNMLQTFFEKTPESNAHLFEGTRVWADPAHRAEQGKYPVISITFKDAKGVDWAETRDFIGRANASSRAPETSVPTVPSRTTRAASGRCWSTRDT